MRDISNLPVLGKGRCYWALVFFRDGYMLEEKCLSALTHSFESKPCKNLAFDIFDKLRRGERP